ncbi:hypothetical protein Q3G72_029922 [Acer saccharum]|nr:hypothetical protein Q3G72_029922 [Acer saccharum]
MGMELKTTGLENQSIWNQMKEIVKFMARDPDLGSNQNRFRPRWVQTRWEWKFMNSKAKDVEKGVIVDDAMTEAVKPLQDGDSGKTASINSNFNAIKASELIEGEAMTAHKESLSGGLEKNKERLQINRAEVGPIIIEDAAHPELPVRKLLDLGPMKNLTLRSITKANVVIGHKKNSGGSFLRNEEPVQVDNQRLGKKTWVRKIMANDFENFGDFVNRVFGKQSGDEVIIGGEDGDRLLRMHHRIELDLKGSEISKQST